MDETRGSILGVVHQNRVAEDGTMVILVIYETGLEVRWCAQQMDAHVRFYPANTFTVEIGYVSDGVDPDLELKLEGSTMLIPDVPRDACEQIRAQFG